MDAPEKKEGEEQETKTTQLRPDALQKVNYIYANNTFLFSSNWDVRFVFAERLPFSLSDSGPNISEPRVGIVMSFQQAKAFHEAFSKILETVEKTMGKINYRPLTTEKEKGKETGH